MRSFGLVACMGLACFSALGQNAVGTSTVTGGVGITGGQSNGYSTALALKGNYEYRLTRHLAAEAGVEILFVPVYRPVIIASLFSPQSTASYTPSLSYFLDKQHAQAVQIPFGLKGILPFRNDRVELFGGLGAVLVANKSSSAAARWMGQVSMGARFAVDKNRHIWIGATGRGFSDFVNPAGAGQQHYSVTADIGFRFGR